MSRGPPNLRFEFLASWSGAIWLRGPKESLCTRRDRAGGRGSLSRRDAVAKLPLGPNVRVFQGPWARSWAEIKTRFYAGNLVSQGPSGTYGVGWMRRPYRYRQPWAGYPMGCHIGRLTRHENWRDLRRPLKFPNLIVSLTRFGHVIEGNVGPLFSIFVRPRRLVIEIGQIWGWVIRPVSPSTVTHPLGWW